MGGEWRQHDPSRDDGSTGGESSRPAVRAGSRRWHGFSPRVGIPDCVRGFFKIRVGGVSTGRPPNLSQSTDQKPNLR